MISQLLLTALTVQAAFSYTWENVHIGGGGGFTPGIVFNPTVPGVAYARTDIGGLYRLNADDSWTPLMDYANTTTWHDWGIEAVATDPVDPDRVYAAVGMYTNSWDPNNGSILVSADKGDSWTRTPLPFKCGGNMPGRGMGERMAVDPQNNKVIYFGARSGHGLWKSTDQGVSFSKVESFTAVGTYVVDPTDTSGYNSDLQGLAFVLFDPSSRVVRGVSSRIYVGTAVLNDSSIYVSDDGGQTFQAIPKQPIGYLPHKAKFSTAENALYVSYSATSGPYDQVPGAVWRWDAKSGNWSNITPAWEAENFLVFGYGGLSLDPKAPGTLIVAACNLWSPDVQIFRSKNSGTSWTTIWDWNDLHYTYDTDKAPWINASRASTDTKVLGWMVEALEIDPHDSDHWLYGTGETLYGGHDLTKWPDVHVSSLADGIEEEAVTHLITPPGRALIAGVGDDGGWTFETFADLKISPKIGFVNPLISTTAGLDYAGNSPLKVLRTGNSAGDLLALSNDGGFTWAPNPLASATQFGGVIAYSADADAIVWAAGTGGSSRFANGTVSRISTLPAVTVLASDKRNTKFFYAADGSKFYVSKDSGTTFNTTTVPGFPASLVANPLMAGDIWLSTASGLFHSTDFGSSFTKIPKVQSGNAIALGKGNGAYLNIYGFLEIEGETALRMSSDVGVSWSTIQNENFGFGSAGSNVLAGSLDIEGLVFVGTNGRGVFLGLP